MLKARLISAAVMVPLVVTGVLYLSTDVFALILGLILAAGLWEWSRLVPLHGMTARLAYVTVVLLLIGLLWQVRPETYLGPILIAAVAWWLWVLYWVTRPQIGTLVSPLTSSLKMAAGVLVIVPAWVALVVLHGNDNNGPVLVLIVLVMTWLADSGAYFAGKQWGRTRLAPIVSPGKTREGVYGGLLASLVFAAVAGGFYSHSYKWTLAFMLVSLLAMMFSVVGDLLESLMKRQSGIKDSGSIIPGHGGILDRIDSMVAAAPMFLVGLRWLNL
ncbi:MAG: phosphatidate cytidylyltransferase [Gammaproteobacteria bacterium]|nr:phosphatidate cytidylyltransferase [Gammaproteobacteria bacterium]